jgi:DNA-directed RNA polymerase subunit beta'
MTEWTKDKETGEFVPSTSLVETTVGRALLSEILPKGLPFSNMNKALKKKEISRAWPLAILARSAGDCAALQS